MGIMDSLGFKRNEGTQGGGAFPWDDPSAWGSWFGQEARGAGVNSSFAGERIFIPGNPGTGPSAPAPENMREYNVANAAEYRAAGLDVNLSAGPDRGALSSIPGWTPDRQAGYNAPRVVDTLFGPVAPDTFRTEVARATRDIWNPLGDAVDGATHYALIGGAVLVGGLLLLILVRR